MDISIADVLVHIDESLSREELTQLEDAVRANEGVVSVRVPEGKSHMMLVAFDPDTTSTGEILHKVMERGVHAELVGL